MISLNHDLGSSILKIVILIIKAHDYQSWSD